MEGRVDVVAHRVGILVCEGPLQVAQDHPDENVLLTRVCTQPGDGRGREIRELRLAQDADLLHGTCVVTERVPDPVAEIL